MGMGSIGTGSIVFADSSPEVWMVTLRGTIDPATTSYLKTALVQAQAEKAEALLVELDTPGGLVSSVNAMAQAIEESKIPVIVFVTPAGASATSAGALLALASHLAAMAPGTRIGAAHPVDSSGKDISGVMGEKVANDTAAFARSFADLRGRNREVAEALVLKSRSLTAEEALNTKLIEIIASDRQDLLKRIDGREVQIKKSLRHTLHTTHAGVHLTQMTWGQRVLHTVANPNIATLLMTLGMLCVYIEITTGGTVIAGVVGGISLLIAFASFQMLPIRMTGLLLLFLGMALLIAEPFVIAHGVLAIGGVISFALGILWVLDPAGSDLRINAGIWIPAVLALGGASIAAAVAAVRSRGLVKKALEELGGATASGLSGYQGRVEILDATGLNGKALIRGETWDIESQERLIVGDLVEVLAVKGMKALVRRLKTGAK